MEDKECINYLKERNEKLIQLESMIVNLQKNANDVPEKERLSYTNLKMEVFKLWYFINYNKKYDL